MPTGYTSTIKDDTTLEQFVWTCARAFGALVLMRDDPSDAPIPQAFEPSDYHTRELERLRKRLAELDAMSPEAAQVDLDAHRSKMRAHLEAARAESEATRARYGRMLLLVKSWGPPSTDHIALRDFMVSQIEDSIRFDCSDGEYYDKQLSQMPKNADEWREQQRAETERSIVYHSKEHAEEVERTEQRNKWIRDLRAAFPREDEAR